MGKEAIMEVAVNNPRATTNNEGVVALSNMVSIVGITLAGAIGPYGLW